MDYIAQVAGRRAAGLTKASRAGVLRLKVADIPPRERRRRKESPRGRPRPLSLSLSRSLVLYVCACDRRREQDQAKYAAAKAKIQSDHARGALTGAVYYTIRPERKYVLIRPLLFARCDKLSSSGIESTSVGVGKIDEKFDRQELNEDSAFQQKTVGLVRRRRRTSASRARERGGELSSGTKNK